MKIKILFSILTGLLLTITSCNVVNLNPVTLIETAGAIKDSVTANQAALGIYSSMQSANYYGQRFMIYGDVYADNAQHFGSFTTDAEVSGLSIQTTNLQIANTWQSMYAVIRNANFLIAALPSATFGVAANRTRYEAEARALRAIVYFDMLRAWGGVPLVLIPTQTVNDVDPIALIPRATEAQVYTQIIADLQFAIPILGTGYGTSGTTGRPFRLRDHAARSILAKVYLTRNNPGDLALAITELNTVIGSGAYGLPTNFADVFGRKANTESIFELNFTINDQNGISGAVNRATTGQKYGARATFGGSFFAVSGTDRRFVSTLRRVSASRYDIVKYFRLSSFDDNIHIIRFADVLLMRAEAQARLDPAGNVPAAQTFTDINLVRTRAGLTALDGTTTPTNTDMLTALLAERRFEFAFEGQRWFDLKRFGQYGAFVGANPLWPIPLTEILRSQGALTQNAGY